MAELDICRSCKWGKEQGGVVGFSHSGWGLAIKEPTSCPSYEMPPFDGIGANEYIVDVVHDVCDFISAVDTPVGLGAEHLVSHAQLRLHRRISGETDFPCIYGERVGLGRGYVKLDEDEPLDFDGWVAGHPRRPQLLSATACAHLIDFTVNGLGVGEPGDDGRASVLAAKAGEPLTIKVRAAALPWPRSPTMTIRSRPLDQKPYWHVERARIGDTRKVPVELIVNGEAVERQRDRGRRRDQRRRRSTTRPSNRAGSPCASSPARTPTRSSSRSTASRSAPASEAPSGASTRSMSAGTRSRAASAKSSAKPPAPPTTKPARSIAKSSPKPPSKVVRRVPVFCDPHSTIHFESSTGVVSQKPWTDPRKTQRVFGPEICHRRQSSSPGACVLRSKLNTSVYL